jgi:hypothetical protein
VNAATGTFIAPFRFQKGWEKVRLRNFRMECLRLRCQLLDGQKLKGTGLRFGTAGEVMSEAIGVE